MPSDAFTSAGTTIGVSAALPATFDAAGFGALTFTDIGEVVDGGELGRVYEVVKHNPLATRETIKRKGSFDSGSLSLQMARVPSDAGQAILVAAVDSDASHSFEVTLQDGTILWFTAQIFSYLTKIGTTNQITAAQVNVEIDSDIVEDAA
jgi:hypothetical protein